MFKLHEGGMLENGILLPPQNWSLQRHKLQPQKGPIMAKAVKMADRYHNPDPLILLGTVYPDSLTQVQPLI